MACVLWLSLAGSAFATPLDDMLEALPASPADFSLDRAEQLEQQFAAVDAWACEQWWREDQPQEVVATVGRLVEIKAQVDAALEQVLQQRTTLVGASPGEARSERLCSYLRCTAGLIDLSGRVRYRLNDVIQTAAYHLDPHPAQFDRMLDLLIENRVGVGAVVMAFMLSDPPPESGLPGYTAKEKYQALRLINVTQQADLIPTLADYIRAEKNPALVVIAAELLRRLGLPQDPRPGSDPDLPQPPMVARQLAEIIQGIDSRRLSSDLVECRRDLLAWLDQRAKRGIVEDVYRLGSLELHSGDWLLMRNPSPYNLFTDLSPGLFTHVGVVTVEQGSDGIRRFVIVDLPERGASIPATNVDTYLMRTLHYFFLRHQDPEAAQRMGQAAAEMIGNECQFDLNFETSRVAALAGKPLKGSLIHTYCAGFLLICAQHSGRPTEEFFPVSEAPAGGRTVENLAQLGLSIGADFVSPSGALFSPQLEISGRREPMYDPAREVQQAIYDYFAQQMIEQPIAPSPDAWQALRESLASAAKYSPWLARRLAQAGNVNERIDLEAAAKAATVIETLDEIAEGQLAAFVAARQAILMGPLTPELKSRLSGEEIQRIEADQQLHGDLFRAWTGGHLTARQLRIELVVFYVQRGCQQLDERFFSSQSAGEDAS